MSRIDVRKTRSLVPPDFVAGMYTALALNFFWAHQPIRAFACLTVAAIFYFKAWSDFMHGVRLGRSQ